MVTTEVELDHVVAFLKAASEALIDQAHRVTGRRRF
jgi:hypothetical protein